MSLGRTRRRPLFVAHARCGCWGYARSRSRLRRLRIRWHIARRPAHVRLRSRLGHHGRLTRWCRRHFRMRVLAQVAVRRFSRRAIRHRRLRIRVRNRLSWRHCFAWARVATRGHRWRCRLSSGGVGRLVCRSTQRSGRTRYTGGHRRLCGGGLVWRNVAVSLHARWMRYAARRFLGRRGWSRVLRRARVTARRTIGRRTCDWSSRCWSDWPCVAIGSARNRRGR